MRTALLRHGVLPVLAWTILRAEPVSAAQETKETGSVCFFREALDDTPASSPRRPWIPSFARDSDGNPILDGVPFARLEAAQEAPRAPEEPLPPHGSLSGFFDQHGSSQAWKKYVWEDELTQPAVLLPLGLAVAAACISPWDKRLEEQWHGLLGAHQTYSNAGQDILVVTSVLSGALFPGDGRNTWDEIWTQGEAFGASSMTVATLKILVGRPRPGSTPSMGTGKKSFPSGHSAAAFTSATLIERNSGLWAGLPAYGLAAFTAFERVEAGRHYPSDVLAGAAIGVLSAGVLDSLHWGSGPGRGIARTPPTLTIGFVDRLHGLTLDWEISF